MRDPTTTIAYGALAPPPTAHVGDDARAACLEGVLLACAFASWAPTLTLPDDVGIGLLYDCDYVPTTTPSSSSSFSSPSSSSFPTPVKSDASTTKSSSSPSTPSAWLQSLSVPVHAECLHGGVCLAPMNPKSSKRCYVGTTALLSFLLNKFESADLFVKMDTDSLVLPNRVRAWASSSSSSSSSPLPRLFYAGNTQRLPYFVHCDGPCASWACTCKRR